MLDPLAVNANIDLVNANIDLVNANIFYCLSIAFFRWASRIDTLFPL